MTQTRLAVTCTPGSVGACEGSNAGLICNAAGNGYTQMPCAIGCDASTLTCTMTCTQHSQCPSGICKGDGSCATDSEIAFTDPDGSPASDCSRAAPCTLDHALALAAPSGGQYVELAAGAYNEGTTLDIQGARILVGRGPSATTIRNTGTGQIVLIDDGGDGTLDSLELEDAPGPNGYAIYCPDTPTRSRSVHVIDSLITNSSSDAIRAQTCTVEIRRSIVDGNAGAGLAIGTSTTVIDQSLFSANANGAGQISGDFAVTNSFFVRNGGGLILGDANTPMFASIRSPITAGSSGSTALSTRNFR